MSDEIEMAVMYVNNERFEVPKVIADHAQADMKRWPPEPTEEIRLQMNTARIWLQNGLSFVVNRRCIDVVEIMLQSLRKDEPVYFEGDEVGGIWIRPSAIVGVQATPVPNEAEAEVRA